MPFQVMRCMFGISASCAYMVERWSLSFSITANTPAGVSRPVVRVDTAHAENPPVGVVKVTCWLLIDTTAMIGSPGLARRCRLGGRGRLACRAVRRSAPSARLPPRASPWRVPASAASPVWIARSSVDSSFRAPAEMHACVCVDQCRIAISIYQPSPSPFTPPIRRRELPARSGNNFSYTTARAGGRWGTAEIGSWRTRRGRSAVFRQASVIATHFTIIGIYIKNFRIAA